MELKAVLNKPYTQEQRLNFIVEYNHKQGYEIREMPNSIEAWTYTKAELENRKKEQISRLSLTSADVERALYKAFGKDFDDIISLVTQFQPDGFDIKALKIELKANNFYRGNPYIDAIGRILGITPNQLDEFFESNDYKKLLPVIQVVERVE